MVGFTAIFSKAWFLPALAICLEIMGIAWGIFIATKVRSISNEGSYGQTMAIFRIPRALITFLGILGIGTFLNQQNLMLLFMMNTLLFVLTSLLLICKKIPKT